MSKSEAERADFIKTLPAPPEGLSIVRLESIVDPNGPANHFYTIGPKHVGWASDHHGGILGEAAIESGEKKGIHCAHPGCRLPYASHKTMLTMFIKVPQNSDLNAVPGLVAYLNEIKPQCTEFGVDGFAFPK